MAADAAGVEGVPARTLGCRPGPGRGGPAGLRLPRSSPHLPAAATAAAEQDPRTAVHRAAEQRQYGPLGSLERGACAFQKVPRPRCAPAAAASSAARPPF